MLVSLLFLKMYMCGIVSLTPGQKFEFEEDFEAGSLVKFEFSEEFGQMPHVSVINENNAIISSYHQSSATLHTKANSKQNIRFTIKNLSNKDMRIWFALPDVLKEIQGPLGPINESDVVTELKTVLENIILSQRKHLERQNEHETLLKSSKRLMTFLLVFEGVFCMLVVYYLHVEIIKLFEKKRRI